MREEGHVCYTHNIMTVSRSGVRIIFALLLAMGAGCRARPEKAPLLLFCGAGLRTAVTPILAAYEAEQGRVVHPTYAGSGHLMGQIAAMGKGDLFMPGEDFYVEEAIRRGLADGATRRTVAWFVPVLFTAKGNPHAIRSLADLTRPGLRVGLGDERACAVGRQSIALLALNGVLADAVADNTVYKSGTVDELAVAVKLGQVDVAIVWDATARHFENDGTIVPIPPELNLPAPITAVVLRSSADPAAAARLIDFMTGKAARRLFEAHHYRTTPPASSETGETR